MDRHFLNTENRKLIINSVDFMLLYNNLQNKLTNDECCSINESSQPLERLLNVLEDKGQIGLEFLQKALNTLYPTICNTMEFPPKFQKVSDQVSDKNNRYMTVISQRDYGRLERECEEAVRELNVLKTMLADTVTKKETIMLERNHFRNLVEESQCTQNELDKQLQVLRTHNNQVTKQKEQFLLDIEQLTDKNVKNEQEIESLRKVISDFKNDNESNNLSNGTNSLMKTYTILCNKFDDLRAENERLKRQLEDALNEPSNHSSEYCRLEDENKRIWLQYQSVVKKRDNLTVENSDIAYRLEKLKNENAKNMFALEDNKRLRTERDAIAQEYAIIMKERDIVLQESEETQSHLKESENKVHELEFKTDKLQSVIDRLKSESVSSYNKSFDELTKMVEKLSREKNEITLEKTQLAEKLNDIVKRSQTESYAKKIDDLKINMASLEVYLRDQELVAFQERDKIILERDSMRSLCDKLRKERDKAVSELADALRELDQLQKHKSKSTRELKSYKDQFDCILKQEDCDVLLNKENIDNDQNNKEFELLSLSLPSEHFNVETTNNSNELSSSAHFSLTFYNKKESEYCGCLQIRNSSALFINNIKIMNRNISIIDEIINRAKVCGMLNFIVKRQLFIPKIYDIRLENNINDPLHFESGIFLSKNKKDFGLHRGDRIMNINGISVKKLDITEIENIIESSCDLNLTVFKSNEFSPESPVFSRVTNQYRRSKKQLPSTDAQTETPACLSSESDLDFEQKSYFRRNSKRTNRSGYRTKQRAIDEKRALEEYQAVIKNIETSKHFPKNASTSRGTWPRYTSEQMKRPTLMKTAGEISIEKEADQKLLTSQISKKTNEPFNLFESQVTQDYFSKQRNNEEKNKSRFKAASTILTNNENVAVVAPVKKAEDWTMQPKTRIYIPPKSAVVKLSAESIEHGSSTNTSSSSLTARRVTKKSATVGNLRHINIEKGFGEQLGINIKRGSSGIIVSSVSQNSLASNAGIRSGDQLLEVCGINLRNATFENAKNVLVNCGNDVTIVVQNSTEKCLSPDGSSRDTLSSSSDMSVEISHRKDFSNASTVIADDYQSQCYTPSHSNHPSLSSTHTIHERRIISWSKNKNDDIGITICGGNNSGIFIKEVNPTCSIFNSNQLSKGDQILEFNGTNMTNICRDKAFEVLQKPCEKISLLAQYNMNKFYEIESGKILTDCLYYRINFDRTSEDDTELQLSKNDIILIDNTMYNDNLNLCSAWKVDSSGSRVKRGILPSRKRLDTEFISRKNIEDNDETKGSKRSLSSTRRSFFRKKKHQRNNSHDSVSYSESSLVTESSTKLNEATFCGALTSLKQLKIEKKRPVVLFGPLSDVLVKKIFSENPDRFMKIELDENNFNFFEDGFDLKLIKEAFERNRHGLLFNCNCVIENLYKLQIYPIVLSLRFRNAKQIQKAKDRLLTIKFNKQQAKDMLDEYHKLEMNFAMKNIISDFIECDSDLNMIVSKCKSAIDKAQKKPIFIAVTD